MSNFVHIKSKHIYSPSKNLEQVINTDHIIAITSFEENDTFYCVITILEMGQPCRLTISATEFKHLYLE